MRIGRNGDARNVALVPTWTVGVIAVLLLAGGCSNAGDPAETGGGPSSEGGSVSAATPSDGSSGGGGGGYERGGYGDAGDGGGGGGDDQGGGGAALAVTLDNFLFAPATPRVASDETITVVNGTSDTPHTFTVTGEEIDVTVQPDASKDVTIDLPPGSYPFVCRFHEMSGMTGTLAVTG